jgi:type II secretory pathway pseudopilin PulG
MNKTTRNSISLALVISICLPSCAGMENMNQMAGGGAVVGALIGAATSNGSYQDQQKRAIVGGLLGAAAGALVSASYKASLEQQRAAQRQANNALRDRSIMKSVKSSGAKYVAVKVKPKPGAPDNKSRMIKVRVNENADGTLSAGEADSTAYPIPASTGSTVRVGMSSAVPYQL